mmetsp:Transcript_9370/g.13302  ORF Transcript_9370/g.13302 Transcript_9370/m.13302 type:complete len:182 (-) Transcript_9370:155-700(-)
MAHDSKDGEEKANEDASNKPPYNIFRDTPIRFFGYANEVGESFRYQFPKLVRPSYIVAFGYCGMDAIQSGCNEWESTKYRNSSSINKSGSTWNNESKEVRTAKAVFDTLIWQSFASVLIPGATINLVVKASRYTVNRTTFLPHMMIKWMPTVAGLASIPFIVNPIDTFVDLSMDNSVRKWL